MKILLPVVFLCCVARPARAQAPAAFPLDKATRRISYAAVVPVAGASQADLQARAQAWANGIAPADQPPLVASEQGTEVVTASGAQPFVYTYDLTQTIGGYPRHRTTKLVLHYTAKLSLREGRYRYVVTDFIMEYPLAKPPSPARLPAEAVLIEARPLNEDGSSSLTAERKAFAEAAAKLQAQLKEKMNMTVNASEAKQ
ncbi:hypothetical protein [Hymenobacter properus]|uniref:DUF4468 domain-containing protein n=1 Tax=Hymenobacter properus TaxID=2791026 RepID=A0A931BJ41_9BACT|nr:hypothetical protein [Hymenobacter properus]MBF9142297.1 hypothetical protein [Hymenobacter properus]MBR7721104.1 hypothetical protein [Microvirga sp. SRT04]